MVFNWIVQRFASEKSLWDQFAKKSSDESKEDEYIKTSKLVISKVEDAHAETLLKNITESCITQIWKASELGANTLKKRFLSDLFEILSSFNEMEKDRKDRLSLMLIEKIENGISRKVKYIDLAINLRDFLATYKKLCNGNPTGSELIIVAKFLDDLCGKGVSNAEDLKDFYKKIGEALTKKNTVPQFKGDFPKMFENVRDEMSRLEDLAKKGLEPVHYQRYLHSIQEACNKNLNVPEKNAFNLLISQLSENEQKPPKLNFDLDYLDDERFVATVTNCSLQPIRDVSLIITEGHDQWMFEDGSPIEKLLPFGSVKRNIKMYGDNLISPCEIAFSGGGYFESIKSITKTWIQKVNEDIVPISERSKRITSLDEDPLPMGLRNGIENSPNGFKSFYFYGFKKSCEQVEDALKKLYNGKNKCVITLDLEPKDEEIDGVSFSIKDIMRAVKRVSDVSIEVSKSDPPKNIGKKLGRFCQSQTNCKDGIILIAKNARTSNKDFDKTFKEFILGMQDVVAISKPKAKTVYAIIFRELHDFPQEDTKNLFYDSEMSKDDIRQRIGKWLIDIDEGRKTFYSSKDEKFIDDFAIDLIWTKFGGQRCLIDILGKSLSDGDVVIPVPKTIGATWLKEKYFTVKPDYGNADIKNAMQKIDSERKKMIKEINPMMKDIQNLIDLRSVSHLRHLENLGIIKIGSNGKPELKIGLLSQLMIKN